MKRAILLIVAFASSGCVSIANPLPMRAPVLVGPISHIGGKATELAGGPDEAAFDKDDEMQLLICEESGIPSVAVTRPLPQGVIDGVEHAYAHFAGRTPLGSLVPRVSKIGVGAWVYFFTGCYGHHYWWNADGHVEGVQ